MKKIVFVFLCALNTTVFADDLGKTTYQQLCQDCHSPKFAQGMNAPAAFDKKAWIIRFRAAELEVKMHPTQYKTPMDYILYKAKIGKGLMPHGGLCVEAAVANKNCSDEALKQAIHYMAGQ
jgi:cytochrome c5